MHSEHIYIYYTFNIRSFYASIILLDDIHLYQSTANLIYSLYTWCYGAFTTLEMKDSLESYFHIFSQLVKKLKTNVSLAGVYVC